MLASFTPGNVVLYRIGDGSTALTNTSTQVFLDEYSPTGTLVQSISMPTAANGANYPLTGNGIGTSEGLITRSVDGESLLVPGYAAPPGVLNINTTTAAVVQRAMGVIDAQGNIDTTTTLGMSSNTNGIRSVTSTNGTDIWVTLSGSLQYVALGNSSATQLQTRTDSRGVYVFNDQLYLTAGSGTIAKVGSGLPKTTGQSIVSLPNISSPTTSNSPFQFVMFDQDPEIPGPDVMYVADDATFANGGGIRKYMFSGSNWGPIGRLIATASNSGSFRGLTGTLLEDSSVQLYFTNSNGLYSYIDASGPTSTIGNVVLGDPIATAPANTAFRGVAFTPKSAINQAPVISVSNGPIIYNENDLPISVAPGGTITDADSTNFDTGALTVSYDSGGTFDDRLAIRHVGNGNGQIGVVGEVISYQGTPIGTFAGGSGNSALVITLNANATAVATQALLRNITFENVSNNPVGGNRILHFTLTDGDGGESVAATTTLNVIAVNDPPELVLTAPIVEYTAGDPPVLLDPEAPVDVVDLDSFDFDTGRLTVSFVSGASAGDRLLPSSDNDQLQIDTTNHTISFGPTDPRPVIATYSGGDDITPLVITFNSQASPNNGIRQLVRHITYQNVLASPVIGARELSFVITDGDGGTSATVSKTINVSAPILPDVSIADGSMAEGNSGTQVLNFNVTLSAAPVTSVTINFSTQDDTATASDGDYVLVASGSVVFNVGDPLTKQIQISINGDTKFEQSEQFFVNLTATGGNIVDGQAIGTITNDDSVPTLSINDVAVSEGDAGVAAFAFTVTLSHASYLPITVNYSTADDTATTADNDYTALLSTPITFAADTTVLTQTVTVNVTGDNKFELDDAFFIDLTDAVNATLEDARGIGTILNDDAKPTISINNVSHNEGNTGGTTYSFDVTLSNPSYQAITVNYQTTDDTATVANNDYQPVTDVLTFAANTTTLSQPVVVTVNGDESFEPDETFFVNLTNTNAANATAQGVGTILNDDQSPNIIINAGLAGGNGDNNAQADNFRLVRNGANLDLYVDAALAQSYALAILQSITIQGSGDDDQLNIDYSGGFWRIPNGIAFDGNALGVNASDNDRIFVTGDPGMSLARETYLAGATSDAGTWIVDPDGTASADEVILTFTNVTHVETNAPAVVFDIILNTAANSATIENGGFLQGANSLQISDNTATFAPARFASKTTARIMGNGGDDQFTVNYSTAAAGLTTLEVYGHLAPDASGQPIDDNANDTFTIRGTVAGVSSQVFGNGGDDQFNVADSSLTLDGILGALLITGGAGSDTAAINDSDSLSTDVLTTLTATQLIGLAPAIIDYASLELLTIDLTDNQPVNMAILGTATGAQTNIDATRNNIAATITVGTLPTEFGNGVGALADILGPVTFGFHDGNGTLQIDDSSETVGVNAVLTDALGFTSLAGLAPALLQYRNDATHSLRQLHLHTGSGDDVIRVHVADNSWLPPGTAFVISISGGANTATGDQLIVVDDGLADLTVHRPDANVGVGAITVGPANPQPFSLAIDGIEDLQFVDMHDVPLNAPGTESRLIVLQDTHENNNDRAAATNVAIGANPLEAAIDPDDSDWYRVTADVTGTLDFTVLVSIVGPLTSGRPGLPGTGDLSIEAYDSDGTLIAGDGPNFGTNDAGDDERIRIPAVQGQVYFLRVFGATASTINSYRLSVASSAPPVPYNLELPDGNLTRDNTPTMVFRLDDAILLNDTGSNVDEAISIPVQGTNALPGYRIAIFDESAAPPELLGFADATATPGVYAFTFPALSDGSHNISARVQMLDPATPQQTGFGDPSATLEIIVDTMVLSPTFGLQPDSDSGVPASPATLTDRITNIVLPIFSGSSEAHSTIRLYADLNNNGSVEADEPLIAQTATLDGQWQATSLLNLNDPNVFTLPDGVRRVLAIAEDLAGNVSMPASLDIYLDTQGPRITDVIISDAPTYSLFAPQAATPTIHSLSIGVRDLPNRDTQFLSNALESSIANIPNNYQLRGDVSGIIPISSVTFLTSTAAGQAALGTIVLAFDAPLPDDRFTLTIADTLVDLAGNRLDGESNAGPALDAPHFPSGDQQSGGEFIVHFSVDSRPELGTWLSNVVQIDTNGNGLHDPGDPLDGTNRDVTYTLGYTPQTVFAGNFALSNGSTADHFDKLATYGPVNGQYQFLIDVDNDGAPDNDPGITPPVVGVTVLNIDGQPLAGRFDDNDTNGDEVGVFDGQTWYFDTNHNFVIDSDDAMLASELRGQAIVGDFDGDGFDDLATWENDTFTIDLAHGVRRGWDGVADFTIRFGFGGARDRAIVANMDGDGIDDLGLWVPDNQTPQDNAQWFFIVSGGQPIVQAGLAAGDAGHRVAIDEGDGAAVFNFTPLPAGNDLYFSFGEPSALPVIGNFDRPLVAVPGQSFGTLDNPINPLDVDADGFVTPLDAALILIELNAGGPRTLTSSMRTTTGPYFDVSRDGQLTALDAALIINYLNSEVAHSEPAQATRISNEVVSFALPIPDLPSANESTPSIANHDDSDRFELLFSVDDEARSPWDMLPLAIVDSMDFDDSSPNLDDDGWDDLIASLAGDVSPWWE